MNPHVQVWETPNDLLQSSSNSIKTEVGPHLGQCLFLRSGAKRDACGQRFWVRRCKQPVILIRATNYFGLMKAPDVNHELSLALALIFHTTQQARIYRILFHPRLTAPP